MNTIIILFVLIIGFVIGSFLNVCIYRIPRNESISFPPSHCTNCGKRIKWYDLFPVVSYIFLKGKCRNCEEKISIRYPLLEIGTGVLFVLVYVVYGTSFEFTKFIVLTSFLIVIGIIDLNTTDVYFKTTLSGIIAGIIFIIIGKYLGSSVLNYIYGAILGGGLISLIILVTHGMGWGDAEICFMAGLFLGFKLTVVMLFLSFILGGIVGIILIMLKIKSRRDYIPFGPYIALSAMIAMFLGERIITWYLSLM